MKENSTAIFTTYSIQMSNDYIEMKFKVLIRHFNRIQETILKKN